MRKLIGAITGTTRDKYEDQIAWIRPLAEAINGSWEAVLAAETEFPSRGSIFWPRAAGAKEHALVRFHAKQNDVKNGGPDEYMAFDSQLVFEVLDLRWVGDCEQVRLALNHGVLSHLASPKCLIRCSGDLVVGPVTLVPENTGKVVLDKNNCARIACYQLGDDAFLGITFDEETRTILAGNLPPAPYSYVDWDDDKLAMRRAIEAAARLKGNGTNLPRQVIHDATAHLTQYGADANARLELYRLSRAKQLAADTQQVNSLAEEIFTGLRNHPSVAQEVQKFYEGQRGEIRARIEAEFASEKAAVTQLRKERQETEQALDSARQQLEKTETKLKEQVSGIEAALVGRIDQVLGNVPTLLADVALLRPFLQERSSQPRPRGSSTIDWPIAKVKISGIKELRLRMIPALRSLGVATISYQPIQAAFASGFMPIVSGARSLEALEAYAHVMCAGRQLVVEVTSAISDVQDLFGKLEHGCFVPHPAGLLDVILAAREHEGPFLVVLDGINRGATESFLLPLLRLTRSRTASIPLFHPQAIDPSDPYRTEARVQWPANLLLAATVIEGPTTLPIAPDVWKDSILATADADGEVIGPKELGDLSEVDGSSGMLDAAPARDQLEWISEELPRLHGNAKRLAGALAALIPDQSAQQAAITKSIVVPYLASITDEEERTAEIARLERTLDNELGDWVNLARRSIA